MRHLLRTRVALTLALASLAAVAHGQAVAPTGAAANTVVSFGPNLNIALGDGTVHYDAKASEIAESGLSVTGTGGGWASMTNAGGDISYMGRSTARPFSLLYSGGYFWSTVSGIPSSTYQDLTVSQGLVRKSWTVGVSDSFSYLPLSEAFGLSGIPGAGDIGVQTGQAGSGPAPTLLTNFTTMLTNTLTADGNRSLNYNTYLSGSASWGIMRFLSTPGLNNNQISGTLGLNRRLSVRNTIGADFMYSKFTYQNLNGFAFTTQGINVTDQRQWSRALSTTGSVGPQWISSSKTAAFPSQLNVAISASLTYSKKFRSGTLGYTRGAMSGVGILPGAFEDSVQASAQQTWGRNWMGVLTGTYVRVTGFGNAPTESNFLGTAASGSIILASNGALDSEYAAVQITRKIGQSLSTYVSYTPENQSFGQSLTPQNALSGFSQLISLGATYAPRSLRLGQF